jgi:hypothetical protein
VKKKEKFRINPFQRKEVILHSYSLYPSSTPPGHLNQVHSEKSVGEKLFLTIRHGKLPGHAYNNSCANF